MKYSSISNSLITPLMSQLIYLTYQDKSLAWVPIQSYTIRSNLHDGISYTDIIYFETSQKGQHTTAIY